MSNFVLLICLFICSVLQQSNADPNVTFAVVIFRHGDRTIISPYPNDPHKDSPLWDIGYGQLTDLGKQEQYELGQTLRERFKVRIKKNQLDLGFVLFINRISF